MDSTNVQIITSKEIKNYCIACLIDSTSLTSLEDEDKNTSKSFRELFIYCTSLSPDELDVAQKICQLCQKDLLIAYNFKLRALEAQLKLSSTKVTNTDLIKLNELGIEECDLDQVGVDFVDDNEKLFDESDILQNPIDTVISSSQQSVSTPIQTNEAQPEHLFYNCENCGKYFTNKRSIQLHMNTHRTENTRFQCNLCDRSYNQMSSLNSHRRLRHYDPATAKKYICPHCAKEFLLAGPLSAHIRKVHRKVIVAKCEYCQREFVDRGRLTAHIRIHTHEKPYKCEICKVLNIRLKQT